MTHWIRMVGAASVWTAQSPARLFSLWSREFVDARIILEQRGELKYYDIEARWQRLAVRSVLVLLSLMVIALAVALAFASVLHAGKMRLEQSHREIYGALLMGTSDVSISEVPEINQEDMFNLALVIRERDLEIRSLVGTATENLSSENRSLKSRLDGSGLTAKTISIIQSSGAIGGFSPEVGSASHSLVRGQFAEEASKNRDLKDVLLALPSSMPVGAHDVTSTFGVRNHPLQRTPKFHAGVDLVPHSDDRVYATRAGKVVLARYNGSYGNTVIVRHNRGIESLYAHLDRIDVAEGDEVDSSTVLGMVGNTGASTGKHLHFEISVGGFPVDPLRVIKTANYVQQIKD